MGVYSSFEVDQDLAKEGLWIEILDPASRNLVCRIKCRPADPDLNQDYRLAASESFIDNVGSAKNDDIMAEIYARCVIVKWGMLTIVKASRSSAIGKTSSTCCLNCPCSLTPFVSSAATGRSGAASSPGKPYQASGRHR